MRLTIAKFPNIPSSILVSSISRLIVWGFVSALLWLPTNGMAVAQEADAEEKPAVEEQWTEDFQVALEKARLFKKDLVLLFTGSDWCPPCKKLEEEVTGDHGFQFEAVQHFMLVKLDFPRESKQADTIKKQNEELAKKYGVESYPTVIVIDFNTKPFGITGYEEGGPENFLATLEEFRQARLIRDEKLAAAKNAEGLERAKLLDQAISGMNELVISVYYEDIVEEIVELDKEDQLGLRSKWNAAKESEMRKIIMQDVLMVSRLESPEKAISFIDEILAEFKFPPNEKISVLQIKLNLVRKLKNNEKLDLLLDEMISIDGADEETRERLLVKKILLMVGSGRKAQAMELLTASLDPGKDNMHLWKARGDICESAGDLDDAVKAYDNAIQVASNAPDVLVEVVAAKADVLFAQSKEKEALQTLDNFADNANMPTDLRSSTLLHKAMMMRDSGRLRLARLAENRAVQIAESPAERGEVEKMIQRLRAKYDDK